MLPRLNELAALIRTRNAIANQITAITGRPASLGHLGEFIAAAVFDIELESSASNRGHDGRFRTGPQQGRTVNIKWYSRHQALIDIRADAVPDLYLVLTGPSAPPASSRGKDQPWAIDAAFLFDGPQLIAGLVARGRRVGIATSVPRAQWRLAEVYPDCPTGHLPLNDAQRHALQAFHSRQMSV